MREPTVELQRSKAPRVRLGRWSRPASGEAAFWEGPAPAALPDVRPLARLLGEAVPEDALVGKALQDGEPIPPAQRLVQRITMGMTAAELELVEELGFLDYLKYHLDFRDIDDSELESALAAALPTLAMSPAQIFAMDNPFVAARELQMATLLRAIYSPRQLFERMVVFWTDHFNIDLYAGVSPWLKPIDDREVIRAHALGTFPNLLRASAHSPAMLSYLTNDSNVAEHPNENYARELMELHTMGVDAGFTQEDVREVARCFTGWRWLYAPGNSRNGTFFFDAGVHDNGRKRVLGHTIAPGGGEEDGERVLRILSEHPATARFLARKLARYFLRYDPPSGVVERAAERYLATGGKIRPVLRILLKEARIEDARPKLKRPFHYMVSALRALGAEVEDPQTLLYFLSIAGHEPFAWAPPNGYPDVEGYWVGNLLPRWNFASFLALDVFPGVAAPTPWLNAGHSASRQVKRIDLRLTDRRLSRRTRDLLEGYLGAGSASPLRSREALSLALASPEFQVY